MRSRGRLLLVGVAAAVLVTQTGGFDAAVADRSVSVAVVDDDRAFLGFEQSTDGNGSTATLTVTVTNRFPGTTDLESVVVEVDGRRIGQYTGHYAPGEAVSAGTTQVSCGDPIRVTSVGEGVHVGLFRNVTC